MKILITGDSHTGALSHGLLELRTAGQTNSAVDIQIRPLGGGHILPTPFFRDVGSHAEIVDEDYRKLFAFLPPKGMKVDVIGLSMPLWPMRVVHQLVWGGLSLAERLPNRQPISTSVFRQFVLQDQRYVLKLVELLSRAGITVLAISGPGLFRDHHVLREMRAEHVLKVFDAYRAVISEELRRRNIPVIDIPAKCLDDDGFMFGAFRHDDIKDSHHANGAFGALMIQSLQNWANTQA